VLIGELMPDHLVTMPRTASLAQAFETIRNDRVRKLPLTDDEGRLAGLITSDDLLALLSAELHELGQAVQKQSPTCEEA